jgi:hypothetical protein
VSLRASGGRILCDSVTWLNGEKMELLLLSNSSLPGKAWLEHALPPLPDS